MKPLRILLLVWIFCFPIADQNSIALAAARSASSAESGRVWVVSKDGPVTTIQQALEKASPGDTIKVYPGVYSGPLNINKTVKIIGEDRPVIDGHGEGQVVSITAPGVLLSGFEIRGSGTEPDRDHAGITIEASNVVVENNLLTDVLFGIFVAQADRAVVRANDITSKPEFDIARKGDGIRVWYSQDVLIEKNIIHESRDVVAWYSSNLTFRQNQILNGRYGVHLMYSDNTEISNNVLLDNSVGIYVMYSKMVTISQNDIRRQRGPSGYALGFKDADDIFVHNNLLSENRAGVFLDGTPYTPGSAARFESNIIAYNDIGLLLFSFVKNAEFHGNTLWENLQQTALQGSGKAGANIWEGNYWSDYAGFDADNNGFGDIPYRSDRFFEGLVEKEPMLRALLFSPAVQAIEFAATSFPVIKPQPKLEDQNPAVMPLPIPASAVSPPSWRTSLAMPAAGLLVLALGIILIMIGKQGEGWMENNPIHQSGSSKTGQDPNSIPLVHIDQLYKKYGRVPVLEDFNLDVLSGESVALWGENGAGKTTLLKAVLGLLDFNGKILVADQNVRVSGKKARAYIGYVPQEAVFYDMSVRSTMAFYARLKKVNSTRIPSLLDKLGLIAHQNKPVSTLSGGLKQRLALAVALLADPPLLLLDEPTANLDAHGRRDYLQLLLQLRKEGKTIIFASHRLEEVETLADRVVILKAGKKVDELRANHARLRLAPQVILTLWVPQNQHQKALEILTDQGWDAHLNGRGTVVIQIQTDQKLQALHHLDEHGILVNDFEVDGGNLTWN